VDGVSLFALRPFPKLGGCSHLTPGSFAPEHAHDLGVGRVGLARLLGGDQQGRRQLLRHSDLRFSEICRGPVHRDTAHRERRSYICERCLSEGKTPPGAAN